MLISDNSTTSEILTDTSGLGPLGPLSIPSGERPLFYSGADNVVILRKKDEYRFNVSYLRTNDFVSREDGHNFRLLSYTARNPILQK
jgi:hypothetical protein